MRKTLNTFAITLLLSLITLRLAISQETFSCDFIQFGERVGEKTELSDIHPVNYMITIQTGRIDVVNRDDSEMNGTLLIVYRHPPKKLQRTHKGVLEEMVSQMFEVITPTGQKRLVIYNDYKGKDPDEKSTIIVSSENEFIVWFIKPNVL